MRVSIVCSIIHDRRPGTRKAAARRNVAAIDAAVKGGHQAYRLHVGRKHAAGGGAGGAGASYWRGEQHLIATAPAWTILRMNFYAEAFVQLGAGRRWAKAVLTGLGREPGCFRCAR